MLITDPKKLVAFAPETRLWQGIPSVEITPKGRLFATFYSGDTQETTGNYCTLLQSDDDGLTWKDPIAVAYAGPDCRCYDPVLWCDPLGRLWFIWAKSPEAGVWAAICDFPDADELKWSAPRRIGGNVMMNKPIVTSTGEWLFPMAIWAKHLNFYRNCDEFDEADHKAFAYRSVDQGRTFTRIGGVAVPDRSFDEHMFLEQDDGSLRMLVRTGYGIGESYSYNGGFTWTSGNDSGLKGPCSRFHIRRLPSGNVLLINHINYTGRNNLMAKLSRDGGKTWEGGLMIDPRDNVAYPDCGIGADGFLYIVNDHERGGFLPTQAQAMACAREIVLSKITEEDILAGKLVNPDSYLRRVVSRLADVTYTGPDLHEEKLKKRIPELIRQLSLEDSCDKIIDEIFHTFRGCCSLFTDGTHQKVDELVAVILDTAKTDDFCTRMTAVRQLVELLALNAEFKPSVTHEWTMQLMDMVRKDPAENWSLDSLAARLHVSKYYLCHFFKCETGISVMQYVLACRLATAKRMLCESKLSIAEICARSGFGNVTSFTQTLREECGLTPKQYQKLNARTV